jgi:hypothetical protein
LARGAGELGDEGLPAQAFCGLGPLGLEEQLLEPVDLASHDGPRHRVQGHLSQPHALEARDQVHLSLGTVPLGLVFGSLPVGPVPPVAHVLDELVMGELDPLFHQLVLLVEKGLMGAVLIGGDEHVHLVPTQPPSSKGLGGSRQTTEVASPLDLGGGLFARQPAFGLEPGLGVDRPRGLEGAGGVETGHRGGHQAVQLGQLALEHRQGLGVGEGRRTECFGLIEHRLEVV